MRTLVVDRNAEIREEMWRWLSVFGECVTAESGEEGLVYFKESFQENDIFDLVCTDIILDDMDGFQMIRQAREIEKMMGVSEEYKAKIVVVSARNESRNVKRALEVGADAYAGRPITGEKFISSLQRLKLMA